MNFAVWGRTIAVSSGSRARSFFDGYDSILGAVNSRQGDEALRLSPEYVCPYVKAQLTPFPAHNVRRPNPERN
jgi:hypothetical protein